MESSVVALKVAQTCKPSRIADFRWHTDSRQENMQRCSIARERTDSLMLAAAATAANLSARWRPLCRQKSLSLPDSSTEKLELPTLTTEEKSQLARGLRVQRQTRQGPQGQGLVVFDVHAPPELVLERLADFENYPYMIPVVRRAKVHSHRVTDAGTELTWCSYRISRFLLGVSVVNSVNFKAGFVKFDLDPKVSAMMLQDVAGFWHVEMLDDHPNVLSRVWLKVDLRAASWLPHWLIDYASERALGRATAWLKPNVEELWSQPAAGTENG